MAQHWIDARKAREIAGSHFSLCERLHAGLIQSRAALFRRDDQSIGPAELPSLFWWAEGHEALQQNWDTGDFSTWIDSKVHLQAFGVQMALDGILEMRPFQERALITRELSVASDKGWLSAKEARHLLYESAGVNPAVAGSAIITQARLGFLSARAVSAQCFQGGRANGSCVWAEREWDIPSWFWHEFTKPDASSQNWDTGVFSGKGRAPEGLRYIGLEDVRFSIASLNSVAPIKAEHFAPPNTNVGGRPPAAFADDLMCAVWANIYQGDLKPGRQADLEKWIKDWVVSKGHEIGDTSARDKARKIWSAMQQEVENTGG